MRVLAEAKSNVGANEDIPQEEEIPSVPLVAAIDGVRAPRQRRRKRLNLKADYESCDCEMCPIEDERDDAEEEADPPRAVRDPGQPTRVMIEEHNLTHIPFRPWCAACVLLVSPLFDGGIIGQLGALHLAATDARVALVLACTFLWKRASNPEDTHTTQHIKHTHTHTHT